MKLAVIPARGGSKRIPGKNTRDFCGKPIMAYSIEAARESYLFEKIIVSTDSEEIAKVAERYGAEIPFMRPSELADDYTGTDAVVVHALEWMLQEGLEIEYVCCIYSTAPFLQPEFLKQGFEILQKKKCDSAFSVTTFPYPIQRALKIDKRGRVGMFWPEHKESRSQDLLEAYHDAGQFYWAETKGFLKEKTFFSENTLPVILPRYLVQDIDTIEDWVRAENMFKTLQMSKVI